MVMWYARCSPSTPGHAPMLTTHCMSGGSTFLSVVRFSRCFKMCARMNRRKMIHLVLLVAEIVLFFLFQMINDIFTRLKKIKSSPKT